MTVTVYPVDPQTPDPVVIARAAEVVRQGGLVAFPTETVYGLGANALDADAVRRIFAAKGRPPTNPVIVHVVAATAAQELVTAWPTVAQALAERFWPGSLTLVLPRRAGLPDEVVAGGLTIAVRVPAHPVALALLQASGVPIAAPSANRSNHLSPTRAEHVLDSLGGETLDVLLDGGPAPGGLESTVVDVSGATPRLLRPGLVTLAQLEAVIGPVEQLGPAVEGAVLRSPGLLARHYAPRTPLELVEDNGAARVAQLAAQGRRIGWLTFPDAPQLNVSEVVRLELPPEPVGYASGLYAALHQLDAAGVERIIVARPPEGEDWLAIHDRLRRASS